MEYTIDEQKHRFAAWRGGGKGDAQLEKFAVQDSQKNLNRPQKELTINI